MLFHHQQLHHGICDPLAGSVEAREQTAITFRPIVLVVSRRKSNIVPEGKQELAPQLIVI
jgi:hypothetical protein